MFLSFFKSLNLFKILISALEITNLPLEIFNNVNNKV